MHSKEEALDRRVRRTQQAIKGAFLELLGEKPMDRITITELAQAADINRKTFYAHYENVQAVMASVENDIVNHFMEVITEQDLISFLSHPYPVLQRLATSMQENLEVSRRIFATGIASTLLETTREKINDRMAALFQDSFHLSPPTQGYVVSFLTGGLFSAFAAWVQSEERIPLEQLSEQLSSLMAGGLKAIQS